MINIFLAFLALSLVINVICYIIGRVYVINFFIANVGRWERELTEGKTLRTEEGFEINNIDELCEWLNRIEFRWWNFPYWSFTGAAVIEQWLERKQNPEYISAVINNIFNPS